MQNPVLSILYFAVVPLIAIIFEGLHRKFIARFENRIGPPILQPYYDLRKLWRKKTLNDGNDPFFRSAPFLYFLTTYALFLLIPFSIISFDYDFILLIYLTILGSAFYTLAGVSSDSPYAIVGSMREMILMVCYEITLAISVFTFMIFSKSLSLSAMNPNLLVLSLPLASIALIASAIVELKITPFDTAEASTEILSSMETEYSGKELFFMEITKYLKRLFYVLLIPLLFFGLSNPALYVAGGLAVLLCLSFTQASTPRYRVDQTFTYLFIIMVIALIEFIRVVGGFTWALP
ncbi:MAG: complex I subunit 1 family protein [archaeon]